MPIHLIYITPSGCFAAVSASLADEKGSDCLKKTDIQNYSQEWLAQAYEWTYLLGARVHRDGRWVANRIRALAAKLWAVLLRGLTWLCKRYIRPIGAECRRIAGGFSKVPAHLREGFDKNMLYGVGLCLLLPITALRRHRKAIATVCNIALPVTALFLLGFTIRYWSDCNYVLAVEYEDASVGYIDKADTIHEAIQLAQDRMDVVAENVQGGADEDSSEVMAWTSSVPRLELVAQNEIVLMNANTICDRILQQTGSNIAELSGLYVNGKFEGTLASREQMDALLETLKEGYTDGSVDERAEFVQDVEVLDGLFPSETVISPVDLKKRLTAKSKVDKYYEVKAGDTLSGIARRHDMTLSELRALNPTVEEAIYVGDKLLVNRAQPYLQVQVVRTEVYEESIPYATKKVKDPSKYSYYERVKTSGKNGVQKVTAEVVYIDGVEQSRKVIGTTVVKAPTDRVIVVGSKEVNPNATKGEATGKFIWPVPGFKFISSYANEVDEGLRGHGKPHRAIDIAGGNIYGATIIASDGGRVVEAGYHWSYGNYVLIDHGGGMRTRYAHCSKLLVSRGDKVKQGQAIGKVGSTGQSSGPHLHFEVIVNGTRKDPLNYVSR